MRVARNSSCRPLTVLSTWAALRCHDVAARVRDFSEHCLLSIYMCLYIDMDIEVDVYVDVVVDVCMSEYTIMCIYICIQNSLGDVYTEWT